MIALVFAPESVVRGRNDLAWIWRVPLQTMRATLFSYAAFVCISLMLWSGCFGRRNTAGATPATRAPVVSTR